MLNNTNENPPSLENGFSFVYVVQKRTGKNRGLFQLITTMWTIF